MSIKYVDQAAMNRLISKAKQMMDQKITAALADFSGSGAVFITYGSTSYSEISTNYSNNKPICCVYDNIIYTLSYKTSTTFVFTSLTAYNTGFSFTVDNQSSYSTPESNTFASSAHNHDASYVKLSSSASQTIQLSSGTGTTALAVKSRSNTSYISFMSSTGWLASLGFTSDKKPTVYDGSSHILAYTTDIITDTANLTNGAGFITSSAISGKEDSSNKVTSISSASTDTQYPSAKLLYDKLKAITDLIPAEATSSNKLKDEAFINSSISTATATFRGDYEEVLDLGLTTSATNAQVAAALASKISTADNNDYCYVRIPADSYFEYSGYSSFTSVDDYVGYYVYSSGSYVAVTNSNKSSLSITAGTTKAYLANIARVDRYKHNGTSWAYEYPLNNSGFTAFQWGAINSGITLALVAQIGINQSNISSLQTSSVTNVSYDSTNKKLKITKNGSTSDIVTFGSNAFTSTTIPTSLAVLSDDATHRLVTDTEKSAWNAKATDSDVVHLAGTETITGSKTFSAIACFDANYIKLGDASSVSTSEKGALYISNSYSNSPYMGIHISNSAPSYGLKKRHTVLVATYNSSVSGQGSIAIGSSVRANGVGAIAIGGSDASYETVASAQGAIQLGNGTNSTANTFQVFSYQMLDANGKIPDARLNVSFSLTDVSITEVD